MDLDAVAAELNRRMTELGEEPLRPDLPIAQVLEFPRRADLAGLRVLIVRTKRSVADGGQFALPEFASGTTAETVEKVLREFREGQERVARGECWRPHNAGATCSSCDPHIHLGYEGIRMGTRETP